MIIDDISVNNWMSFYGEHTIDLSIRDGKNGNVILIHGETGKGKTSVMSAIRWVVTGTVRMLKTRGGHQAKIIRHLMMFEEPNWKGSLLNWDAYDSKTAGINVTINFRHDGNQYMASRGLWAKNPEDFDSMGDEVDASFTLENKSTGKTFNDDDAQRVMDKICPPRLLKFYVIEGDFITEYQDTLFSSDMNIDLVDSVTDAIGLDAVRRMTTALNTILSQSREHRLKVQSDQDKDTDFKSKIEYLTRRKREVKEEIDELTRDVQKLGIDLEAKKTLLESKEDVKHVMEESNRTDERKILKEEKVESDQTSISKSMGRLWKMVWTPVAKNLNQNREYLEDMIEELRDKRAEIRVEIKKLRKLLDEGVDEHIRICLECERPFDIEDKVEEIKPEDIKSKIGELETEQEELEKNIAALVTKKREQDSLCGNAEKNSDIDDLIDKFTTLKSDIGMIHNLEKRMQQLSDKLGDEDDGEIQQWVEDKLILEGMIKSKEERIHWLSEGDDNSESLVLLEKELNKLSKRPVGDGRLKKELEQLDNRIAALEILRNSSRKTETTHLERMRGQLNQTMTVQFRSLITDPIDKPFYHELRTSDDWSVTCYTDKNIEQPIENPGHLLRGTLAYLGGLRESSGIEFPVVLDNPAAPLDQEGRDALAELLVGKSKAQTILLTHSGGYALTDLLSKYGGSIAQAYKLKTTGKGDRIQSHVEPVGGGLQ